jgi:hypothetical protein
MFEEIRGIVEFLSSIGLLIGSWAVIGIMVLYLVIFQLDKLEYFASKVLSVFQWTGTNVRKQVIAKDIRSRILKVSKEVTKEVKDIMPYDLKICWVKETNFQSFVEGNQVIVRMNNKHTTKTKNVVYALSQYVENGLMPKARNYIDKSIIKCADLVMTRKLLITCYEEGLNDFDKNYLSPVMHNNADMENDIRNLMKLDEAGLFVRILLKEFMEQSQKIYPQMPDPCLIAESSEFVRFLYNVVTKETGDYTDLIMNREYFKVGVIILFKEEILSNYGYAPYITRAFSNFGLGIQKVYLLADTATKSTIAREIAIQIKDRDLRVKKVNYHPYKRKLSNGKVLRGICIEVSTIENAIESEQIDECAS